MSDLQNKLREYSNILVELEPNAETYRTRAFIKRDLLNDLQGTVIRDNIISSSSSSSSSLLLCLLSVDWTGN